MNFDTVTLEQIDEIQFNAGVLLNSFDPEEPEIDKNAVICATTGGINPSCVPTYDDLGEDIDNCPNDTMELKRVNHWECLFSFTSIGVSETHIKLSLGAADKVEGKIVPRATLKLTDFKDVWWVGEKLSGGWVAIRLKNALSNGGFTLQTTKKGKGQVACVLKGHTSLSNQEVPMEFYSAEAVS